MGDRKRKGRIRRSIPVLFLFLYPSGILLGEEHKSVKEPSLQLPITEQVTVTASRFQEKIVRVAGNVSVITDEDIANSTATDIPNLLRTQSNIQVTDIAGNRRFYAVDLRGFGESSRTNILVLVDGRRVNSPSLSGVDWIQIPLERVKRIEIIRGGRGSVLYGDNAGSGVINIITLEEGQPTLDLELSTSSYESLQPSAQVRGSRGLLGYGLSGTYSQSHGYRDNTESQRGDFGGNLGFEIGGRGYLELSGGIHTDNTGLPGAIQESQFEAGASRTDSFHSDDFVEIDDYYLLVRPEVNFLGQSTLQVDLSARRRESKFFSSFVGGTFEGQTQTDMLTISPQLVLREKVAGLNNNLSFGYDFVNGTEDIVNTTVFDRSGSSSVFELTKINHGGYLYNEVFPLDSLALSAGYRYDWAIFHFNPSTPSKISHNENLYTAGVNYRLNRQTFLYANYSKSFRYAVLDEMFNFFSNTIDIDLLPQTGDDLETGIKHNFTNSFYGNLNLFRIDTDREIFFNPIGGVFGFGANENFKGRTRRLGLEIATVVSTGSVRLRGSYSFVRARVNDGYYAGNQVPSVAGHKITAESFIPLSARFMAGINASYVGERYFQSDWSNDFGKQKGYLLLNARLSYQQDRFTLFLDLNNILNRKYSELGVLGGFPLERSFYPSPKFNARLGIRLSMH